jgi:hypothetical protein
MDSLESDSEETELVQEPDDCLLPEEDLYKAFVHGWQVVKLNFPKYIDKVVIIKIKQTVIQFGYTGRIFQYVFICLKKNSGSDIV